MPSPNSASSEPLWRILLARQNWRQLALWAVVSVLMTGIPAAAEAAWRKWTSKLLTLGFDELFAMTAPLILSIAGVSFAWKRRWLVDSGGMYLAGGMIVLGGWLGHWWGHPGAVAPLELLPSDRYGLLGQLVFGACNQLAAYGVAYGPAASISSVLVGWTMGRVWNSGIDRLLPPVSHAAAPESKAA